MPIRACFACKKRKDKNDFLNFKLISKDFLEREGIGLPEEFSNMFRNFSSVIFLDLYGKIPGKGINVCPQKECIKKTLKKIYKGNFTNFDDFLRYLKDTIKKEIVTKLTRAKKASLVSIGLDNISLSKKNDFLIVSETASKNSLEKLKNFFENILILKDKDFSHLFGLENKNIKYFSIKNTPLGKDIFRLLKLYSNLENGK